MKALIVAGGEKPSAELLIDAAKDAEIIIGADRGCEIGRASCRERV